MEQHHLLARMSSSEAKKGGVTTSHCRYCGHHINEHRHCSSCAFEARVNNQAYCHGCAKEHGTRLNKWALGGS